MARSLITKLFPVPKTLTMPAIGVDISGTSIKVMELKEGKDTLLVKQFGEVPLPASAIKNGEVENRDAVRKALAEARARFGLDKVVVSLPEEKAFVFELTIPYVPPKELRSTIELQLEEHIPLPPEEVVFDYVVAAYNKQDDTLTLGIGVLPQKVVTDYLELFDAVELFPLRVETAAHAAARAVVPTGDLGTFMLIDFGRSVTSFSIFTKGLVAFNATVDFGGDHITWAIMKHFKISYKEAEEMKCKKSFFSSDTSEGEDLFDAAISSLSVLKDELNKYVNYWNGRAERENEKKVEKIYFCGGGAALDGLADFFSRYSVIPFAVANPWVNVLSLETHIPPLHMSDALRYSSAIGLALSSTGTND